MKLLPVVNTPKEVFVLITRAATYFFWIFMTFIIPACDQNKSAEYLNTQKKNVELEAIVKTLEDKCQRTGKELLDLRSKLEDFYVLRNRFNLYLKLKAENSNAEMTKVGEEILKNNPYSSEASAVKLFANDCASISNGNKVSSQSSGNNAAAVNATNKNFNQINLKDLKIISKCTIGDVDMQDIKSSVTKKWVFDSNSYDYHYREVDKGSVFLVFNYVIKSKNKNPILPVFVAAKVEQDGKISILGLSDIHFPSWTNYGAYLGNYRDFKNDFAKRDSVHFTAAIQVSEEVYKSKKLIVFVPDVNCASRYEGDGSPPVSYMTYECKDKIEKFNNSSVVNNVVKIFN